MNLPEIEPQDTTDRTTTDRTNKIEQPQIEQQNREAMKTSDIFMGMWEDITSPHHPPEMYE